LQRVLGGRRNDLNRGRPFRERDAELRRGRPEKAEQREQAVGASRQMYVPGQEREHDKTEENGDARACGETPNGEPTWPDALDGLAALETAQERAERRSARKPQSNEHAEKGPIDRLERNRDPAEGGTRDDSDGQPNHCPEQAKNQSAANPTKHRKRQNDVPT